MLVNWGGPQKYQLPSCSGLLLSSMLGRGVTSWYLLTATSDDHQPEEEEEEEVVEEEEKECHFATPIPVHCRPAT